MSLVPIADFADRRLDPYRNLKQTNDTSRRGLFVAEGDKLVWRLLESPFAVDSVLLSEKFVDEFAAHVPDNVPTYVVPEVQIESLVGFNFHRGVLACGRRPQRPTTIEALATAALNDDRCVRSPTFVICPDVQDPENLGTIVRISAGFGTAGLILGPHSADPFSRRVQRVSMGTVYRLPIAYSADVPATLRTLREQFAVESWAAVLDVDAAPLDRLTRPSRIALVFGSEGHGLTTDVVAACDRRVTIPMRADVDSFNVAVAAGIFLYETTRETKLENRPPSGDSFSAG